MNGDREATATRRELAHQPESSSNQFLKKLVNWAFFISAFVYSIFHAYFVISNGLRTPEWLMQLVREHYAVVVVLPFAGYAALGLVLLLESRSENPLEFKAIGFEFKGASGPIVLWVLCLLAIAACIKMLW